MPEMTYRDAVIRGIAQEMERDEDVVFLGEDVAKAGGVFKATVGLYEMFGPLRVRDTPISEQAILGAAMGAAMTGLKPIAEIKAFHNVGVPRELMTLCPELDAVVCGEGEQSLLELIERLDSE